MAEIITTDDLPLALQSAELVELMVDAANAKASRVAPCLTYDGTVTGQTAPTDDMLAEARLVLVGMVKRWSEAGSGALQATTAGPFGATVDTRQRSGYNPWPTEIKSLQDICQSGQSASGGAFSIRPTRSTLGAHMLWCSIMFGAAYCSCGADLTNYEYPLYEGGALTLGEDFLTDECL